MSSTGFILAGTGNGNAEVGGDSSWTNASNITASDGSYAYAATNTTTKYLHCTNFNFAIPEGSTINGITVRLRRAPFFSTNVVVDHTVQLIQNGTRVGDNKADLVTTWTGPLTFTNVDYGSSADMWGTTLTSGDINLSAFGVAVRFAGTSDYALVDAVSIAIEYTDPVGEPLVAGSFVMTGNAATFIIPMKADAGSFAMTGNDVTFLEGVNISFSAETGSFIMTGQDAGFLQITTTPAYGVRFAIPRSRVVLPIP